MAGVQFTNMDQLIKAYNNTQAPCWAVFSLGERRNDKERLMTKGDGADTLRTFLSLLKEGTVNIRYILKIYEDIEDPKQVKENTAADGSFDFTLTGDPYENTGSLYSESNNKNKLFERLGSVEKKLDDILNNPGGAEEEEDIDMSISGVVKHFIKKPAEFKELAETFKIIFSSNQPMQQIPYSRALGHVSTMQQNTTTSETQEQRALRGQAAVNILEAADPRFIEHMEKLAQLAQQDRSKFNTLLSLLDSF